MIYISYFFDVNVFDNPESDASLIGKGNILDNRLVFKGVDGIPFSGVPSLEKSAHFTTPCSVWDITEDDMKELEGMIEEMRLEYTNVKAEIVNDKGNTVTIDASTLVSKTKEYSSPYIDILDSMFDVYERFGFDSAIVHDAQVYSMNKDLDIM